MKKALVMITSLAIITYIAKKYIYDAADKMDTKIKKINVNFEPTLIKLDILASILSPYLMAINLRVISAELRQVGTIEVIGQLAYPVTATLVKGENHVYSSYVFNRSQIAKLIQPIELKVRVMFFGFIPYTHKEVINVNINM
jgi:hypothetical protein